MGRYQWGAIVMICCLSGCQPAETEESRQSSEESSVPSAAGLVHLDESAQEIIGIETSPASVRPVPEIMRTTGWLMPIPGKESVIKALGTGVFEPSSEQTPIQLGNRIASGQRLGKLRTVLTPQEESQLVIAKEEADVLMNQALVSKQLAEHQLQSIQEQDANNAVAGTRLLELRETIARNEVAFRESRDKLFFLPTEPYAEELNLRSIPVASPLTGQISAVYVAPNQLVLQGDPLCMVSDWTKLWIKVPVFADDFTRVVNDAAAAVYASREASPVEASRVDAVMSATGNRRSMDMIYLVDNTAGQLLPGQPVAIDLPIGKAEPKVVVAHSAIIWDGLGDTWIYVKSAAETFRRVRVELGPSIEGEVAINRGVQAGDLVVVVGAQSIYGDEFKNQLQAEDDD